MTKAVTPMKNRRWLLARRPEGLPEKSDFRRADQDMPGPDLRPGEILVRNKFLLCAPTMRNWISGQSGGLFRMVDLDTPVLAPGCGIVGRSASEAFPPGTGVTHLASWQDYQVTDAENVRAVPEGVKLIDSVGRFGLNSLTAYFGLLRVGEPVKGETVVVSGAAGSTGSTVVQIAKIMGCRVVGIAGGSAKGRWLIEECGADAVIDYKNENVAERLAALCPKGIDIFYDNVGGDILQAAIDNMAKFGRVVLCGQIASYNDDETPEGPRNMMRVIYGSIRLQGFLLGDFAAEWDQAIADLKAWSEEGRLGHRIDLRRGFDELPIIFRDLFTGANEGTLLVDISAGD